jgi:aminomethyltransferase
MKKTILNDVHKAMGAKMVEFAGFEMPLQFEGVSIEHNTVRKKVGVFDVSHMGEFEVKGPEAFELVQRISSNDVAALYDGKVQYSCMPNDQGGIVDDFLVYQISKEYFLLVVNASNIEKDWNWVSKQNIHGADLINVSDDYAQLAVQGPDAMKTVQKLTDEPVMDMKFYTSKILNFAGVDDVIFSTTGYTGSDGCEIYMKNQHAKKIYQAVLEAGAEYGIKPIGLGARDTLRLEAGLNLYGNDIDDTTSPIEGRMGWVTKFVDGNEFINRNYHEKLKANKPARLLRGFEMIDKGVPRQHYEIVNAAGERIGEVTSGTMSPYTGKAIGMGYVKRDYKIGDEIFIKIRDKLKKAILVKPPFFEN